MSVTSSALERETADLAETLFVLVSRELARQHAKWGDQHHDLPYWLGILGEEYGEVCKAVIESASPDAIVRELTQLMAVAIRVAERATRPTHGVIEGEVS
jgi:hypothetical protein